MSNQLSSNATPSVCRFAFYAIMAFLVIALLSALGNMSNAKAALATSRSLPKELVADFAPFPSWEAALAARSKITDLPNGRAQDAVTLAYAALEIKDHFEMLGTNISISNSRRAIGRNVIILEIVPDSQLDNNRSKPISFGSQASRISVSNAGIKITAETGVGVLYGSYTFLEQIGFDWPDAESLVVPKAPAATLALTEMRDAIWIPKQEYRGFWVYEPARHDDQFLIWMARKKFNVGPGSSPDLRKLLGIFGWGGGHHLLEEVFSEAGLFERHPDWFSRIRFFKRRVASKNSPVNPAFASKGAAIYFADKIAERLEHGDLKNFDILNVWQVDARSRPFDEGWKAWWVGNPSDNMLVFYANVVDRLSEHVASGRLGRKVVIAGASYYQTMVPPRYAESARRLEGKPYLHLFYPIERDWSPLAYSSGVTATNRRIMDQINGWKASAKLAYGVVDYHNKSKYGGLALNDYQNFADNYAALEQNGMSFFAYMHVTRGDPGPRRLTHALASSLGWRHQNETSSRANIKSKASDVIASYFTERYEKHASAWQHIYGLAASATSNTNEMFGTDSLYLLSVQNVAWAEPIYSSAEVNEFIAGFEKGGRQLRPGRVYGGSDYMANFIGINTSISQIEQAILIGRTEAANAADDRIRQRMQIDLAWLESTLDRYRAARALGRFLVAEPGTPRQANARQNVISILAKLEKSPQLEGTLSPVDQKEFIKQYKLVMGSSTNIRRN